MLQNNDTLKYESAPEFNVCIDETRNYSLCQLHTERMRNFLSTEEERGIIFLIVCLAIMFGFYGSLPPKGFHMEEINCF